MSEAVQPDLHEVSPPHLEVVEHEAVDTALQAVGSTALTGVEAEQSVDAADEAVDKKTSSEEILKTLMFASGKMVYDLIGDQRFRDKCRAKNIDPYDDQAEGYWAVFEDFAASRADALAKHGAPALTTEALRLVGATPRFVFSQLAMSRDDEKTRGEVFFDNVPVVAKYNDIIRNFATQFPEVRATELGNTLKNMMSKFVYGKDALQLANRELRERIWGAQHEVAFEQVLKATGLPYRRATEDEDRLGADYFVNGLGIDVKASMHMVHKISKSDMMTYGRKWPSGDRQFSTLVMYSLLERQNFVRDGFFVSDEIAQQRAVRVKQDIERELAA